WLQQRNEEFANFLSARCIGITVTYVLCHRQTQGTIVAVDVIVAQRSYLPATRKCGTGKGPESSASLSLSTIVDTQGARWVLIEERIILSAEPAEVNETMLKRDLRNGRFDRIAVSQGSMGRAQ